MPSIRTVVSLDEVETLPVFISGKISRLAKARSKRMSVPPGVVVLEEAFDGVLLDTSSKEALTSLVAELGKDTEIDSASNSSIDSCSLFAVRSGFSAEDSDQQSMAGQFLTLLNVSRQDIPASVEKVVESANRCTPPPSRRDVFIMPMLAAELSGVSFTETEYEDDLVNLTTGLAESLVSGADSGLLVELPKLRNFESSRGDLESLINDGLKNLDAPFLSSLQELLRDVRRVFGQQQDWDIEWVWDGNRAWLLQVRLVTAPTNRNELFTIANHKEILPELPSRFMSSLIETCSHELFDYYHQFDSTLPKTRPFCEVFSGRVFINLSLFRDMMRIFGLPTSLVTNSIGGGDERSVPINFGRLFRKIPTLMRLGIAQLMAGVSARRAAERLLQASSRKPGSFAEAVEAGRTVYKGLVKEMFSLTSAMSGPVALLRLFGVLNAHVSKPTSVTALMWVELSELARLAASDDKLLESLKSGQEFSHPEFEQRFNSFMERYGHRGFYESDLSKPRFKETPDKLKSIIANGVPAANSDKSLSIAEFITAPLGAYARSKINARERFRHEAMRSFELVRKSILERIKELEIPIDADEFWLLSIEEVKKLDTGWVPDAAHMAKLKGEQERLGSHRLPDLLRRFDDLSEFIDSSDNDAQGSESEFVVQGNGLTGGTVTGRALVLEEPALDLPPEYDRESTILVCRAVDAGWLATFAQVAGVCVEVGGDLSHGSILLREVGLPSVTNARGIFSRISNGDTVTLEARHGTVRVEKALQG